MTHTEKQAASPEPNAERPEVFESKEQEAYLGLIRTHEQFTGGFARLFAQHALSMPQYNVLRILRGAGPGGVPVQKIAERMVTRDPDVTRLVDRLVKTGYVSRKRCDADRRVVWVRLTERGAELLGSLDQPVRDLHRAQLAHMNETELTVLIGLLAKARRRE
ncbi:MAG: MarR family transcriptional regulator [Candidatus Hydrogenedentes bacterium]|nr:MarR family transcriptional regulator [Candidatus Hydrogenedentota bacterium]